MVPFLLGASVEKITSYNHFIFFSKFMITKLVYFCLIFFQTDRPTLFYRILQQVSAVKNTKASSQKKQQRVLNEDFKHCETKLRTKFLWQLPYVLPKFWTESFFQRQIDRADFELFSACWTHCWEPMFL